MMIVADASAVIDALHQGPAVKRLSDELICAPHLIDVEIVGMFRRSVLTGKSTAARARDMLDEYAEMDILRYEHSWVLDRVWDLRDNVSAYDAHYVALAEWHEVPLVTGDARLAGAPGIYATVELIPVGV